MKLNYNSFIKKKSNEQLWNFHRKHYFQATTLEEFPSINLKFNMKSKARKKYGKSLLKCKPLSNGSRLNKKKVWPTTTVSEKAQRSQSFLLLIRIKFPTIMMCQFQGYQITIDTNGKWLVRLKVNLRVVGDGELQLHANNIKAYALQNEKLLLPC